MRARNPATAASVLGPTKAPAVDEQFAPQRDQPGGPVDCSARNWTTGMECVMTSRRSTPAVRGRAHTPSRRRRWRSCRSAPTRPTASAGHPSGSSCAPRPGRRRLGSRPVEAGAAVDQPEVPGALQRVEVAADGHVGHGELAGEVGDREEAGRPEDRENPFAAARRPPVQRRSASVMTGAARSAHRPWLPVLCSTGRPVQRAAGGDRRPLRRGPRSRRATSRRPRYLPSLPGMRTVVSRGMTISAEHGVVETDTLTSWGTLTPRSASRLITPTATSSL